MKELFQIISNDADNTSRINQTVPKMNPIVLRISTDIDITRMISKALTAMLNKYPSSPPDIQKNDVRARCDLLPGDLAGRIIALEFECESDKLSSVLVHELVMLYTRAVEYYADMSSSKYKLYEKRMVSFLKQPAIEGILKGKASHLVVAEQSIMKATEDVKNVQKHADRLLKKSEMCEYRKQSTIAKELNKQESILEARIGRRRSMSNRSTTEDRGDDFEDMPKPKKIITLNSFENSYDLEMSELIRSKIGRMAEEKKQVRKVVHL